MFDYTVLAIDAETLLLESKINLDKAKELLIFFALQRKAKSQKIFPETIQNLRLGISKRMMSALDNEEFTYEKHQDKVVIEHYGEQTGYLFENASVSIAEIMEWARKVGLPVGSEFENDRDDKPSVLIDSSISQLDTEPEPNFSEFYCQALNVENINDEDLKSMGDDSYPTVKFYAALYSGLLMGRSGGVTKDTMENALKKMGFVKDMKVKDKDFQLLWKAIPTALKLRGRPPS